MNQIDSDEKLRLLRRELSLAVGHRTKPTMIRAAHTPWRQRLFEPRKVRDIRNSAARFERTLNEQIARPESLEDYDLLRAARSPDRYSGRAVPGFVISRDTVTAEAIHDVAVQGISFSNYRSEKVDVVHIHADERDRSTLSIVGDRAYLTLSVAASGSALILSVATTVFSWVIQCSPRRRTLIDVAPCAQGGATV